MSLWSALNRNVFKRTSTFALVVAGGTFFFERTFEVISVGIFESINKGKLWKDIKHKYEE
ncbi:Cytochrome b-c1 complex subunit 9 [Papilio machaon]|uniref:Complex III subunit 9 n=1 Tax=Papilio machaon TaxID=76193 RepID=A0A194R1Q0_PAPMA|nr:cytochrome b-c1 complex subunit 9 [Papilio machaon]KPJ11617.1 Cytochrome b-c1 complex subunit 9 [Papilio machaon]